MPEVQSFLVLLIVAMVPALGTWKPEGKWGGPRWVFYYLSTPLPHLFSCFPWSLHFWAPSYHSPMSIIPSFNPFHSFCETLSAYFSGHHTSLLPYLSGSLVSTACIRSPTTTGAGFSVQTNQVPAFSCLCVLPQDMSFVPVLALPQSHTFPYLQRSLRLCL